jgi:hypothetical protein
MADIDYCKLRYGKTFDELTYTPSFGTHLDKLAKRLTTKYPLRLLGMAVESGQEIYLTEEERYANFQIIGAPGEGKSKFLEYHIRRDIDLGNGLLLLDPSDKGDTAQNVLNYCASIGHKKVIWIDPRTISDYKKIPCLAPLSAQRLDKSVDGVMEALEILFKADYASMRRIRRNLSALLRIMARNGLTLNEARYFSDFNLDKDKREQILGFDRDSMLIRSLFTSQYKHEEKFSSTVNILDVLWREPLWSILGNTEGINFKRVVGDGWVVLVNLSLYQLTDEQSDLLGILIISQIIQAIDALANNNWKGKFHLYIDEAGFFATPQIKTLLLRKRKSGMVLYLAHHDYEQFEDRKSVLSAIETAARIKLMFDTPHPDDRLRMVKSLGYGGDIPPALAAYANQNIPKQHAVLRKHKETPVRIRIPDVEPAPPAPEEYILEILSQPFYKDVRSAPTDTQSIEPRKVDDYSSTRKAPVSRRISTKPTEDIRPSKQEPPKPPEKRPIKI